MIKRDRYSTGACVFLRAQFGTVWSCRKRTRTPSTRILHYLWFDLYCHHVIILRIHVKKILRSSLNIPRCTLFLVLLYYVVLRFSIRSTLECSRRADEHLIPRLRVPWKRVTFSSLWMSHPPPQNPHGRKFLLLLILRNRFKIIFNAPRSFDLTTTCQMEFEKIDIMRAHMSISIN